MHLSFGLNYVPDSLGCNRSETEEKIKDELLVRGEPVVQTTGEKSKILCILYKCEVPETYTTRDTCLMRKRPRNELFGKVDSPQVQ